MVIIAIYYAASTVLAYVFGRRKDDIVNIFTTDSTNADVFSAGLVQNFLPKLPPNSIIVMDRVVSNTPFIF
jgi:hypothetical protein